MNISCVICGELFSSSSDVQITPCGHMYHTACILKWLERSSTCPQCRSKCIQKSIHKVFFNIALDTSLLDIASLQQELDNNVLKNNIIEKELENSKKENDNLKKIQKNCMKTITGLEKKIQGNQFLIQSYSEKFKIFENNAKIVEEQRKEIKDLKSKIDTLNSIDQILNSTTNEVDKLLKQCLNKQDLAQWVVTLKRELRGSEIKRTDLRNTLKVVQHDAHKINATKKLLEEKILELESENYHLNSKIKEVIIGDSIELLSPIQLLESKIKNHSTQILKTNATKQIHRSDTINNNNTPTLIMKNLKTIEESQSPYLNIKSSSIGLSPLLKVGDKIRNKCVINKDENHFDNGGSSSGTRGTLRKVKSDLSDISQLTIMKKPRLSTTATTLKNQNLVFNGFGGSEKKLHENYTLNIKKNPNLNNRIKKL